MKKRKGEPDLVDPKTGKTNAEYYHVVDPETGEFHQVEPEFCLMSRGARCSNHRGLDAAPRNCPDCSGGIGKKWVEKYGETDLKKDFLTFNGNKMSLPKYYDSIIESQDPDDMLRRKQKRRKFINPEEQTEERLSQKRKVTEAKTDLLQRNV